MCLACVIGCSAHTCNPSTPEVNCLTETKLPQTKQNCLMVLRLASLGSHFGRHPVAEIVSGKTTHVLVLTDVKLGSLWARHLGF